MTPSLQKAIATIRELPDDEQDAIAAIIVEELEADPFRTPITPADRINIDSPSHPAHSGGSGATQYRTQNDQQENDAHMHTDSLTAVYSHECNVSD